MPSFLQITDYKPGQYISHFTNPPVDFIVVDGGDPESRIQNNEHLSDHILTMLTNVEFVILVELSTRILKYVPEPLPNFPGLTTTESCTFFTKYLKSEGSRRMSGFDSKKACLMK